MTIWASETNSQKGKNDERVKGRRKLVRLQSIVVFL